MTGQCLATFGLKKAYELIRRDQKYQEKRRAGNDPVV
jgi:hypothetical protein